MKNVFLVGVILLGLIGSASAQWACPMYGNGIGSNVFGWLFNILIVIALVLFIFWLIKQINKKK